MSNSTPSVTLSLRAALAALALLAPSARAQPTAFTFQGQLKSANIPAQGLHDVRFRLFDALTGGSQVATTLCIDNIPVTDGVFTTQLDFGPQFTTSAPRFIEMDVRRDTGLACANPAGFLTLGPRQPVSPSPIASHAARASAAFTLESPDGSHPNSVFVSNAGSVGIATSTPLFNFWIDNNNTDANTDVIIDSGLNTPFFSALSFFDRASNKWGLGKDAGNNFFIAEPNFQSRLTIRPGGNVGINNTTPSAKLDVRGDATFGDTGNFKVLHDGSVTIGNIGRLSQLTVAGQNAIEITGFQPFITMRDENVNFSTRLQSVNAGISFQGANFLAGIADSFMFMDASGRLGIHRTPTVDLDVVGNIRCTSLAQTSSAAFKDNVTPLAAGLDELLRLRPVSYVWNNQAAPDVRGKHDLGFIAEEVEKVLPDAVAKDADGAPVGIDYSRITVLAVKAIKEQQARHQADRAEIQSLRERLERLEAAINRQQP